MDSNLDPSVIQAALSLQNNANDPQAIQLARRQRMVDALREQSMTPLQGQMVSGHYVGPGIMGNIANVGAAALAARQQPQIDTGVAGLQQQRIGQRSTYLNALMNAMRRGQPATPADPSVPSVLDPNNPVGQG